MGKRRPKVERYGRKRELRLIHALTKSSRDANSRPRPIVPDYIAPDLVLRGDDCGECGWPIVYHMRYDAACCPTCNEWREEKCSDPECMFCPGRPDLPLTLEEWGQWMSGELVAREIVAPTKEEAKRESKRQRRLNYLRANKKEKARNDKRGIKWRDKRWRRKRERWDASKGENAHEQTE